MSALQKPTAAETLLGYSEITVKLLNGQEETVRVRQLPMRQMKQIIEAAEDPAAMISLATGKKIEWTDNLPASEFERLSSEADRINSDFLSHWVRLQKERGTRLASALSGNQNATYGSGSGQSPTDAV